MTGSIKKRQQASIPSVPTIYRRICAFLTSMRTALTVLQGDGNKNAELDRAVTLRELQDQVVNINPQAVIASLSNAGKGGSGSVKVTSTCSVSPSPRLQPTGVRVDVALNTAILSWDPANYGGLSHTEIFRQVTNLNAKGEPVDPPRFDEAKLIHGTSSSSVFVEPADSNKGYYYWVRHVNIRGPKSPLNSTEGVFGKNELQLDGGVIKPKTVSGTSIMDDAIETEHLAANSVTSGKILAGSIGTNHLIAGSIVGDHIAAGAITGGKIAADTIDGGKIVAGTYIRSPIIDAGIINASTINGGTINGVEINSSKLNAATGDFSGSVVARNVFGEIVLKESSPFIKFRPTGKRISGGLHRFAWSYRSEYKDNNSHSTVKRSEILDTAYDEYVAEWAIDVGPFSFETVINMSVDTADLDYDTTRTYYRERLPKKFRKSNALFHLPKKMSWAVPTLCCVQVRSTESRTQRFFLGLSFSEEVNTDLPETQISLGTGPNVSSMSNYKRGLIINVHYIG
ncbi:hypothetical protein INT80_05635 [Gallibacterium anatis]|uniref:Fibronectin type-III domain-containing protein n=1 Tax=Gallibacterium anatis TaxID=750 RepID=A0A930Y506_9PAST|nr:hypothetical protein [Gallibacterium anatis]